MQTFGAQFLTFAKNLKIFYDSRKANVLSTDAKFPTGPPVFSLPCCFLERWTIFFLHLQTIAFTSSSIWIHCIGQQTVRRLFNGHLIQRRRWRLTFQGLGPISSSFRILSYGVETVLFDGCQMVSLKKWPRLDSRKFVLTSQ